MLGAVSVVDHASHEDGRRSGCSYHSLRNGLNGNDVRLKAIASRLLPRRICSLRRRCSRDIHLRPGLHKQSIWIRVARKIRNVSDGSGELLRIANRHRHRIVQGIVVPIHLGERQGFERSNFERSTSGVSNDVDRTRDALTSLEIERPAERR
jgi:hypothetical protein